MPVPAHTRFGDGDRTALLLHGILGNQRNWRTMARRLVDAMPGWSIVTVDLRNHGDSQGFAPPHTVRATADDLDALGPAQLVVGHSFGGKVALAYADRAERVVVLDAAPGPLLPGEGGDVRRVVEALVQVPMPVARRQDVATALAPMGHSIAQWMTTNLRRIDDSYTWSFDLDAVQQMLADYAVTDLWPVVENPPCPIDIVRAARSDRWTPAVMARLAAAPVTVRTLDAGHWVHVDDPDGVVDAIAHSSS